MSTVKVTDANFKSEVVGSSGPVGITGCTTDTCNYDLLLGGDYVLGVWRKAKNKDLDDMRSIGIW